MEVLIVLLCYGGIIVSVIQAARSINLSNR